MPMESRTTLGSAPAAACCSGASRTGVSRRPPTLAEGWSAQRDRPRQRFEFPPNSATIGELRPLRAAVHSFHSLVADRSTASLCNSGSFQLVLTLGQQKVFDLSNINPAKMFPAVGMQKRVNRVADKEICVFCAVNFSLKTLRKLLLVRRFPLSAALKIKMVRSVFATDASCVHRRIHHVDREGAEPAVRFP